MNGVNPYLTIPNGACREAIEFYKAALGAEVLFVQTVGASPMNQMADPDRIVHASLNVSGSVIMMADDLRPPDKIAASPYGESNISLAIGFKLAEVSEVARIFGNLAEGGTVTMPVTKTYWAEAFGMLTDRFGIKWMLSC